MTCFSVFSQTDGASAVLIMSEEKALAMGFKPKAYLRYLELQLCIEEVFFFTLNSIRMSSSFILSCWQRLCLCVPGPQRPTAFGVNVFVFTLSIILKKCFYKYFISNCMFWRLNVYVNRNNKMYNFFYFSGQRMRHLKSWNGLACHCLTLMYLSIMKHLL